MRALYHHGSQIAVSFFTDALLWLALSGVPPARFQPQKTTDLATLQKPMWVFYGQHIGQRDLRSYTLHLLEQGHFRVHFLGDFLHPRVVFLDALVQRFDFFEQRLQNLPQLGAQGRGQLPAHLLRATLGQPLTIRLTTATAIAPMNAMRIEKQEMMRVLHDEHEFAGKFISYMLERNIKIEADLVDQLFNSSEKRLARALLILARYGKAGEPETIVAKISQETLAELVGTTRSRVNLCRLHHASVVLHGFE